MNALKALCKYLTHYFQAKKQKDMDNAQIQDIEGVNVMNFRHTIFTMAMKKTIARILNRNAAKHVSIKESYFTQFHHFIIYICKFELFV